jgi:hypothetical protein
MYHKFFDIFSSEKVAKFSNDPKFDDYVYLTFRNNQYGCIGMGYVGTVCSPNVAVRSNLNEWLNDDMTAGHVKKQLKPLLTLNFFHTILR